MKNYKKWTPEERYENLKLFKTAEKLGLVQIEKKCSFCGQTRGIIQTHCTDYDVSRNILQKIITDGECNDEENRLLHKVLIGVCGLCHQMLHIKERGDERAEVYFADIKNGWKPSPTYKIDFNLINKMLENYEQRKPTFE